MVKETLITHQYSLRHPLDRMLLRSFSCMASKTNSKTYLSDFSMYNNNNKNKTATTHQQRLQHQHHRHRHKHQHTTRMIIMNEFQETTREHKTNFKWVFNEWVSEWGYAWVSVLFEYRHVYERVCVCACVLARAYYRAKTNKKIRKENNFKHWPVVSLVHKRMSKVQEVRTDTREWLKRIRKTHRKTRKN